MEGETPRNRVLTSEEYSALLENSPSWLRRAIIMAWQTALSRSDLFHLTWSEIDTNEGIIELKAGRGKTGKPQAIPIFSPELQALISELHAERRRVLNVDGLVLTIDGAANRRIEIRIPLPQSSQSRQDQKLHVS
jgi:integrase